jgi:hypothetical protein
MKAKKYSSDKVYLLTGKQLNEMLKHIAENKPIGIEPVTAQLRPDEGHEVLLTPPGGTGPYVLVWSGNSASWVPLNCE